MIVWDQPLDLSSALKHFNNIPRRLAAGRNGSASAVGRRFAASVSVGPPTSRNITLLVTNFTSIIFAALQISLCNLNVGNGAYSIAPCCAIAIRSRDERNDL